MRRLEIDVAGPAYRLIEGEALSRGITVAEYLRRSLNLLLFLEENADEHGLVSGVGRNGPFQILVG